jgi:inward rectifier potassium channel
MDQENPSAYAYLRRDGYFVMERYGIRTGLMRDVYHQIISLSWRWFLLLLIGVYLGINFIFACLYTVIPDGVAGTSGNLMDHFFFAVETMSTVGYGAMSPQTPLAHGLMVVQSVIGFLLTAVSTGLMFAKFSRVKAEVLFSRNALIHLFNGKPVLTFRAANKRNTQIVDAQINVTLVFDEVSEEGIFMRRLHDLKLSRQRTPLFALVWNVYHTIDTESPLYGLSKQDLMEKQATLIITLYGIDDSLGQTLHTRYAYDSHDFAFFERFADITQTKADGTRVVDYRLFHDRLPQPGAMPWELAD